MEEHLTDSNKRRRIEEQQRGYFTREYIRSKTSDLSPAALQDLKKDLVDLQEWERDPKMRDMIKTVSRVVQSMEIRALGSVMDVLKGGRLMRPNALQQLYRLWGDTRELGLAAHAIRRAPCMRAAFVELVLNSSHKNAYGASPL